MRTVLALLCALAVLSCGEDDFSPFDGNQNDGGNRPSLSWDGRYSGVLTQRLSCPGDATPSIETERTTIELRRRGSVIEWMAAACPGMTADIDGAVAFLRQTTCPVRHHENGLTTTTIYTSGTASLYGDELSISLRANLVLEHWDGRSATCSGTLDGLLTRD